MRRCTIHDMIPRLSIKDLYPNHYILMEMRNGGIELIDTTNRWFKETHSNMECYLNYHNVRSEANVFHFLNFQEITTTKVGKFLLSRRANVESIHIKSKLLLKDLRILDDALQFSSGY